MTTQMEEPAAFLSLSLPAFTCCSGLKLSPIRAPESRPLRAPLGSPPRGCGALPKHATRRLSFTDFTEFIQSHSVSFSLFQFLRVLSSSLPLRPERQFEIDFCSPIRPDILMTFSSSEKPISLSEILLINDSNGATRTSSRTIFCRLRALEFAFFSPKTDEATKR